MLYTESNKEIQKLLHISKLTEDFYMAVVDFNYVFDPITYTSTPSPVIDDNDLAILVLLSLRAIRNKLMDDDYQITEDDIQSAINEMRLIVKKIYEHSYRLHHLKKRISITKTDFPYNEEEMIFVRNLFDNILRVLGIDSNANYSHYWSDEEHLKRTLIDIIFDPIFLDQLPMDILAIIDREYYTKVHEELNDEKAMASWFDIIDSLTEDQLENIVPIKLFIFEALGNKFPRWTSDSVKQKLTDKIKNLKNPQPSQPSVVIEQVNIEKNLGTLTGNSVQLPSIPIK